MLPLISTRGLFLLAALFAGSGSASAAPPRPHWLWAVKGAEIAVQRAFFRKAFSAPAGVKRASVMMLADDRATVFLDGEKRLEATGYQRPATWSGDLAEGEHLVPR